MPLRVLPCACLIVRLSLGVFFVLFMAEPDDDLWPDDFNDFKTERMLLHCLSFATRQTQPYPSACLVPSVPKWLDRVKVEARVACGGSARERSMVTTTNV